MNTPQHAPDQLDFGQVLDGKSASRTLSLTTNAPGYVTVNIPPGPFRVAEFREMAQTQNPSKISNGQFPAAGAVRSRIKYQEGQNGPFQWSMAPNTEMQIDVVFAPKAQDGGGAFKTATMNVSGPGPHGNWVLPVPLRGSLSPVSQSPGPPQPSSKPNALIALSGKAGNSPGLASPGSGGANRPAMQKGPSFSGKPVLLMSKHRAELSPKGISLKVLAQLQQQKQGAEVARARMMINPGPQQAQPGPQQAQPGPIQVQPGPIGTQSNPGPISTQTNPGPIGTQKNSGPSQVQPGPTQVQPGPISTQSNPGPISTQKNSGPSQVQPGPVQSQPGPIGTQKNQPGPIQTQPGPIQVNPGPINSQSNPGPIQSTKSVGSPQGVSVGMAGPSAGGLGGGNKMSQASQGVENVFACTKAAPNALITSINGQKTSSVVFTTDPDNNLFTLTGCNFGDAQGSLHLYGGFAHGNIPFEIQFWNDKNIVARVQPDLTGELDRDSVSLVVVSSNGHQTAFQGLKFYAARQTYALTDIPNASSKIIFGPPDPSNLDNCQVPKRFVAGMCAVDSPGENGLAVTVGRYHVEGDKGTDQLTLSGLKPGFEVSDVGLWISPDATDKQGWSLTSFAENISVNYVFDFKNLCATYGLRISVAGPRGLNSVWK
jgi:hypothetical protein